MDGRFLTAADSRGAERVCVVDEDFARHYWPQGHAIGERVFHQKFGYGRVRYVEGNKLTVEFDKAGEKRVIDQFVSRA